MQSVHLMTGTENLADNHARTSVSKDIATCCVSVEMLRSTIRRWWTGHMLSQTRKDGGNWQHAGSADAHSRGRTPVLASSSIREHRSLTDLASAVWMSSMATLHRCRQWLKFRRRPIGCRRRHLAIRSCRLMYHRHMRSDAAGNAESNA